MIGVHFQLDRSLVEEARRGAELGPVSVPKLIRYALAKLAGWPDAAARVAARIRDEGGGHAR